MTLLSLPFCQPYGHSSDVHFLCKYYRKSSPKNQVHDTEILLRLLDYDSHLFTNCLVFLFSLSLALLYSIFCTLSTVLDYFLLYPVFTHALLISFLLIYQEQRRSAERHLRALALLEVQEVRVAEVPCVGDGLVVVRAAVLRLVRVGRGDDGQAAARGHAHEVGV